MCIAMATHRKRRCESDYFLGPSLVKRGTIYGDRNDAFLLFGGISTRAIGAHVAFSKRSSKYFSYVSENECSSFNSRLRSSCTVLPSSGAPGSIRCV